MNTLSKGSLAAFTPTELQSRPIVGLDGTRENGSEIAIASLAARVPTRFYDNKQISAIIGYPGGEAVLRRLKIKSRGFFCEIDEKNGLSIPEENLEVTLAEQAGREALERGGFSPKQVIAIVFISCTAQYRKRAHFSRTVFELHGRLELPETAFPIELDAGCGGFLHALHLVNNRFRLNPGEVVLIIASSMPSHYINRKMYANAGRRAIFSGLVFGDAVGAVACTTGDTRQGVIRATWSGTDSTMPLVETGTVDGYVDPIYAVDYGAVGNSYVPSVEKAVREVVNAYPQDLSLIDRAYFHQANADLPHKVADQLGIPRNRVPLHADKYANTAAACIPVMLAQDVEQKILKPGMCILLGAVGAGASYGGALIDW